MAKSEIDSEKEILSQIAKGDQEAFTLLFDRYYIHTRNYIFRLTESQEITEELVQEIFIKVWQKRESLPSIESFKSYLFILSRNRTLNQLRNLARTKSNESYWIKHHAEESYQLDSTDFQNEFDSIITEGISSLPPQQQKVYQLSRHEHLKYDEIAAQMGISKETVKKHMQHALSFLKNYVKVKIKELVANVWIAILFLF